ncbi:MAG: transposase [Betaproteobacteria bacterium]
MPRQPRFWFSGMVLHVVQRGHNRAAIFEGDVDRRFYLRCLADVAMTHGVAIHAYVLMTNHVHLLVSPATSESMPRAIQSLGRRYVGWYNHVHSRTGTLWDGRYKAALVDSEAYLLTCMRYIEQNPVRAGMVDTPEAFPWSSYRANALGDTDALIVPHDVYAQLGRDPSVRQAHYRQSFGHVLDQKMLQTIRDASRFEWAIGDVAFCRTVEGTTGRRMERMPMGPRPYANERKRVE